MGIEVILCDAALFHCVPKLVILYHEIHLSPLTFLYYGHKMTEIIVSQYRHLKRREKQIYCANQRLCSRLGKIDEDADVELIINNFLEMSRILCLEMYRYGQQYGRR